MNVTCNKCSKKYVISDDKVAGKTSVKIRCKQCQNLITVAVTGAASAPVSASASGVGLVSAVGAVDPVSAPPPGQDWEEARTRAMPQLDLAAAWYAMITGKQQGPFDVQTLQRKVTGGEVTLRTYLWKPGMSDWKRAADVPEVSPIFAGVSVGATATGPTQPSAEAQRPLAKTSITGHRDVAVANETPVASEPARRKASTVVYGTEESKAATAAARAAFEAESDLGALKSASAAPEPAVATSEQPAHQAQQNEPEPKHEAATESTTSGSVDPFSQLAGPVKEGEAPPPGEATKFFIAKAGVNKRNPPWKIALFLLGGLGIPVLIGWVLTTFGVVHLPTVTRTDENGEEVQESFFSPGGLGGLKDALTGDARRKKEAAERKRRDDALAAADKADRAAQRRNNGTGAGTAEPVDPPEVKPPPGKNADMLLAIQDDIPHKGPKVRKDDDESKAASVSGGLAEDAAKKIIGDNLKAFHACIEGALRRNPNLSAGKVIIELNVGKSGAVTSASVTPEKHKDTDWARCMVSAGKRIVFPSSDAETTLQVPLIVGVSIGP